MGKGANIDLQKEVAICITTVEPVYYGDLGSTKNVRVSRSFYMIKHH